MPFLRRAPLRFRAAGADFILHDPRTGSVHRLNSVAAVTWHLCDGTKDRFAITAAVAAMFGKSAAEIAADVFGILERFVQTGLVHASPGTRELELLLYGVRLAIGSRDAGPSAGGSPGTEFDWNYLLHAASHHGVVPLLCVGLRTLHHDAVPADVIDRLERQFHANAARNARAFERLLEILALLEAHDIPAVPLKGPILSCVLYRDVAVRQFGDLDILVPPDCGARAAELLAARGFRFRRDGDTAVRGECSDSQEAIALDLQWALAPKRFRFPIDATRLWSRLERVSVGGATVWQPAPADQAVLLSAHAAKHCWSRLKWIADLAAFVDTHRDTLDWRQTVEYARLVGGARLLLLGVRLAGDLLGTAVPAGLSARMLRDRAVTPLSAAICQRLFADADDVDSVRGSYGALEGGLAYIKARERLRDKAPFVGHLVWRPVRRAMRVFAP
ncbi:MAG TPA: PqqD family peptide modification chaperone [Vicinamibacterales bacterium]|nr:PqqD family peptide modification chaperone [Vicinamibacterales bacterium]